MDLLFGLPIKIFFKRAMEPHGGGLTRGRHHTAGVKAPQGPIDKALAPKKKVADTQNINVGNPTYLML
jgi:hypothetical protein